MGEEQVAHGLEQDWVHLKSLPRTYPYWQAVQPREVQLMQLAEHIEHPPVELV